MRRVVILWMLLLGSSAASALDVPLTVDGRSFNVHVPPSYKEAEPAPVVVLLHGYTSSGAWAENYMEFEPLSDQEGFLYVYPDGTLDCLNPPNRFWNATNACCNFCGKSVDDVGFLSGVLDELEAQFTVDTDRIYFVGHSNGGFMSYQMACEVSDRIAAIVSLAGATWANPQSCNPSQPVHVLQIHGTNDDTILYEGGNIIFSSYPGAVDTVELWADYNGCSLTPDASAPNLDLVGNIGGAETSVTRYESECDKGGSAELWTMAGGGHNPNLSGTFSSQVIDYLLAHTNESAEDSVPVPAMSHPGVLVLALAVSALGPLLGRGRFRRRTGGMPR